MAHSNFLHKMIKRDKKGAMQMSVGTIVTIVLLMSVLVLGLVLVRSIFTTSTNAIEEIDQAVENEINNLFTEDNDQKVVILPNERVIRMDQGDTGGFAYSIKNQDLEGGSFTYSVDVAEVEDRCELSSEQASNLINLGRTHGEVPIELGSGDEVEPPKLVSFRIPDTAPICAINYRMNVEKDGSSYTGVDVRLEIV